MQQVKSVETASVDLVLPAVIVEQARFAKPENVCLFAPQTATAPVAWCASQDSVSLVRRTPIVERVSFVKMENAKKSKPATVTAIARGARNALRVFARLLVLPV